MIGDRTKRETGQEGQPADDHDDADQQARPQQARGGKLPALSGVCFLAARLPATASIGMMMKKRPIHIATPSMPL
jgi:hypothetical protein